MSSSPAPGPASSSVRCSTRPSGSGSSATASIERVISSIFLSVRRSRSNVAGDFARREHDIGVEQDLPHWLAEALALEFGRWYRPLRESPHCAARMTWPQVGGPRPWRAPQLGAYDKIMLFSVAGTVFPMNSPAHTRSITLGNRPLAITANPSASVAIRAASSLVDIPPRPRPFLP